MPPANVFDEARDALERSVRELREQLSQAEAALEKLGGKTARRGPGRPKGSTRKASRGSGGGATATRRRRKRRGGTRADQAVKLVADDPGITASQIATRMKIKPNYLYRVLGELEKEGRVKKKGRQYHPA